MGEVGFKNCGGLDQVCVTTDTGKAIAVETAEGASCGCAENFKINAAGTACEAAAAFGDKCTEVGFKNCGRLDQVCVTTDTGKAIAAETAEGASCGCAENFKINAAGTACEAAAAFGDKRTEVGFKNCG